ncbi:hypothetical protein ACLIMP_22010 [Novosphingobium aerophilum]|uniref:hypothetical protein n=1 Tax=Novosphingobium aerophilum TaxID=2839843 RepID=UPI003FD5A4C3
MLQIVQGRYFRDVPLTDTTHRGIFYTNLRAFGDRNARIFPFGRLLPSTTHHGIGSFTVEAIERLESQSEDGQREVLAATSGDQLLEEIAAVISFCTNVVCVRDVDMARRLISHQENPNANQQGPASILRQTFDKTVVFSEYHVTDIDQFMRSLIALNRKSYEAAIRAIRQIVDAMLIVDEDSSLAYTLMVAALESLGQASEPEVALWSEYDPRKRARIDEATKGLCETRELRIRTAILANEHLSLQRRFVAFVIGHVEPSFYREEAIGAVRPIAAAELPSALRQAYAIRSRNVHALENLAPEIWMAADRADTAFAEGKTLLSLEGLARLCRHVVRRFVERAPCDADHDFNYRSALPGIFNMRLASQYWVHQAAGFNRHSAPAYFDGMVEFLIEGMSGRSEAGLVDMGAVLDVIERSALGLSDREDRLPMAGMMAIWNACAPADKRRNLKKPLREKFEDDLAEPSMVSFAVKLLLQRPIPWTSEAMVSLSAKRRAARRGNSFQVMPKRIDAALHLLVADRLLKEGNKGCGLEEVSHAVETVPGIMDLIRFEEALKNDEDLDLDIKRFILSQEPFIKPGTETASDISE